MNTRQTGRPRLTRLRLSGIDIPPVADRDIRVRVALIDGASDMRRTVNADLVNVSRAVFRKYSISISGSDCHVAGLAGLTPGDYLEILLADPISISIASPSDAIELPRAGVDVVGVTPAGVIIRPIEQPASPEPLQTIKNALRISELRARQTVYFSETVSLVRYRAVLACGVVNWTSDYDERLASSGWSLDVEEI